MVRPDKKAGKGSRHVLCYWSCRRSAATATSVQRHRKVQQPIGKFNFIFETIPVVSYKGDNGLCLYQTNSHAGQRLSQARPRPALPESPPTPGAPPTSTARRAEPRPRPVPARGLAGSHRLPVRAADGRSFRRAFYARPGLRRMLRGGEGRGAESGARQRSAISVQAPPPFSRRLSVLVGCAALRPAGQRFVLLGDGRVRATTGAGGGWDEARWRPCRPLGAGTSPRAGSRRGCRAWERPLPGGAGTAGFRPREGWSARPRSGWGRGARSPRNASSCWGLGFTRPRVLGRAIPPPARCAAAPRRPPAPLGPAVVPGRGVRSRSVRHAACFGAGWGGGGGGAIPAGALLFSETAR